MTGPVLVVCTSSVTRALLVSLLESAGEAVRAVDSVARALEEKAAPCAVIVEGAIVRASPEALERLRAAWPIPASIVLADRAYADERRGAEDARAFGACAAIAVPPDITALREALRRARGGSLQMSAIAAPTQPPAESAPPMDDALRARYIERLWSRLESLDAYQILRVSPAATQREIVDAFRERALEFHPDRNVSLDEEARERVYQIFKRVAWAFRKVGDPNMRKDYDASRAKS